jgi:hypothetical protein
VYHLSKPSDRAEFDRKVEDWGAKCYQATLELVDPPYVLTEEMLRDYLARFMEHIEVDDEEYARQSFVDMFQIGCVAPEAFIFPAFRRYFLSGETRNRTGDTMIFRHVPYFTVERRWLR